MLNRLIPAKLQTMGMALLLIAYITYAIVFAGSTASAQVSTAAAREPTISCQGLTTTYSKGSNGQPVANNANTVDAVMHMRAATDNNEGKPIDAGEEIYSIDDKMMSTYHWTDTGVPRYVCKLPEDDQTNFVCSYDFGLATSPPGPVIVQVRCTGRDSHGNAYPSNTLTVRFHHTLENIQRIPGAPTFIAGTDRVPYEWTPDCGVPVAGGGCFVSYVYFPLDPHLGEALSDTNGFIGPELADYLQVTGVDCAVTWQNATWSIGDYFGSKFPGRKPDYRRVNDIAYQALWVMSKPTDFREYVEAPCTTDEYGVNGYKGKVRTSMPLSFNGEGCAGTFTYIGPESLSSKALTSAAMTRYENQLSR